MKLPEDLSDSQKDALDKVQDILGEHFDHYIVSIGFYTDDKQYLTVGGWEGGIAPAIGLCQLMKIRLEKAHLDGAQEEDETDD